jgi:D-galactarolactone cycloisomerase
MKVTAVESVLVSVPYRRGGGVASRAPERWPTMPALLVRVDTDAGVSGWGEAFGFHSCATTRVALETLVAPLAVGRDPADIAGLSLAVQRALHTYGRSGPLRYAMSGLDIALWDLAGKVAGKPLYQLLGGGSVETIPAYASLLRYGSADLVAQAAAGALGRGYRHVKLHEIGDAEVKAARAVVGPDVGLTLDANCAWSAEEAIAFARATEPFGLGWIEEPLWPPEDCAALGTLAAATKTPIAAGENATTRADFERLIAEGGVQYIQPSVTKIGGISAMIELIELARERGVKVAPHSAYFGPGLVATVHVCAALAPEANGEWFYCDLEARPYGAGVEPKGGRFLVPQAPGLGCDPDQSAIRRYRVG